MRNLSFLILFISIQIGHSRTASWVNFYEGFEQKVLECNANQMNPVGVAFEKALMNDNKTQGLTNGPTLFNSSNAEKAVCNLIGHRISLVQKGVFISKAGNFDFHAKPTEINKSTITGKVWATAKCKVVLKNSITYYLMHTEFVTS